MVNGATTKISQSQKRQKPDDSDSENDNDNNTGLPNLYAPWWQTRELKVAGKKVGKSLFSYKNDEWSMFFFC